MKPKPTKSAPPRLLQNGRPDRSNAGETEALSRAILAALAEARAVDDAAIH